MTSSFSLFFLTLVLTLFVSEARYIRRPCPNPYRIYRVTDRCGRKCVCIYGRLTGCFRVRKEFTTMNYFERFMYVRTIRRASTLPKYKAKYDKLITEHRTLFFTGIHDVTHFLPWHRYFIWRYENLLRTINCRFTVAYWDWGMDSGHPWRGLYRDVWSPRRNGLGGNGVGTSQCVKTGPFREGKWKLTPSADPPPCLKRRFNGNTPDTIAILQLLMTPHTQFINFEISLRVDFHDNVHCLIDGTMCTLDSANAPEFFLHHGFIDKIWEDWQKKNVTHRLAYYPGIKDNMPGTTYPPSAFLYLSRHPDGVRAIYNERRKTTQMMRKYKGWSVKKLSRMPGRNKFSFRNVKAMKMFRVTKKEMNIARKMAAKFSPNTKPIA